MQQQLLGDYRVIKQIGQGIFGPVLLAEHRFIKKQYVLKVLASELCQSRDFIERFEAEVIKLASLDHPHIVKIHNVTCAEGLYFLVSDCIVDSIGETTNLAHYMSGRKERLREEELLSVMRQIASALDYAHTKGQVSHLALKLNNILIGKGNPGIDLFISDFGLSKIVAPGKVICRTFLTVAESLQALPVEKGSVERYSPLPIEAEKLSKLSHCFLQSFAFLAPEQKRFEQVSAQADSYAFGVLAYFLITGQFPEGAFEKPSKYAPDYHFDWDEVVFSCLQQDPVARPSQLLPLLEKRKIAEPPAPIYRPIIAEEAKEPSLPIEQLKATLKRESPEVEPELELVAHLTPVIQRQAQAVVAPSLPPVEQKEAPFIAATPSLATISVVAAPDEAYSQQLNSMLNRDPVVTKYQPELKESALIEPLQTEMVVIRGGEFFRGSNQGSRDEMPYHQIKLEPFALDIHPVTNEQFVRFLEFMGGEKDQNYNDLIRLKDSRLSRSGWKLAIESGYAKHPVVGVTWYGAFAYAKWAGKRLPSEAEWEIAARGGLENMLYPTGGNIEKNQANFFSSDTTKVMSYAPNIYGIYDLAGNVYEWCQDWYGYNYYETCEQEPYQPLGPQQGVYRVLRGGCWKSLKEDMRASHRHRNNPGTVNSTYGFRCAANVH